jgi:hypothetical protein
MRKRSACVATSAWLLAWAWTWALGVGVAPGQEPGREAAPTGAGVPAAPSETPPATPPAPEAVPRPAVDATVPPPVEAAPPAPPGLSALGRIADAAPLPLRLGGAPAVGSPGMPPRGRRPIPGSPFNPGASGPGIGYRSSEMFLDGALDVRSGWPFVFLDHFAPRPERLDAFWIVQTRDCPQDMGSDPWSCLKVLHFDHRGDLVQRHPGELLAQTIGRPVLIQVQGNLTTADMALGGLLWTHTWLQYQRALTPDVVVVAFDWPSERVYQSDVLDVDEKSRRAYVAAYHLARFLQGFPAGSRICLLGQSFGGRVVPAALHLLGGGSLNSHSHDRPVRLPACRSDLHLRAVVIAGASDHDWLDPGERLDRALPACEGLLNLYNRRDEALVLYRLLLRSGHHQALGRLGLTNRDFRRLGPLAARYEEHDLHDILGDEHTLLDAVANPQIARWIAPYAWAPDPGPGTPRPVEQPSYGVQARRRLLWLLGRE